MLERKKFQQWDQKSQLRACTIPQHVSSTKNPDDENTNQIISHQEKYLSLLPSIREKLSSAETGKEIQLIGKQYGLGMFQMADISRAVRSYYFKEMSIENLPKTLSMEMNIDISIAQEISTLIIRKIINDTSQEEHFQSQLEKLSLSEAIRKYPAVGEQLITGSRISLKSFPEPVRPSVKNWLSDYTFNMGFDPHDSATRGIYLFQNKNTRGLSGEDQRKLGFILRAFDTNEDLEINTTLKQIIFPREEIQVYRTPVSAAPKNTIIPRAVSFSAQANKKETSLPYAPSSRTKLSNSAISGTFVLAKKEAPKNYPSQTQQTLQDEKRLPVAPDDMFLSSGKNPLPEKRTHIEFTSPQKMPFEKEHILSQQAPIKPKEVAPTAPQPIKIITRNFKNTVTQSKNIIDLKG